MFYFYGYDWTYLVFVLPFVIIAMVASANVNSTFKKYSKQLSRQGITGARAAERVLSSHGINNVRIERVAGNLTDHFDPKTNVIRLSDSVYDSTSTAAIGVACHEAGHAVQYAKSYNPIKIRTAIFPVVNIGSHLAIPLILLGVVLTAMGYYSTAIVNIGIACFGLTFLFQLITLPVEFNASARAISVLRSTHMLDDDELAASKKVLTAAALTYVAALLTSLLTLLRLLVLAGGRSNRR